MSYLHEFAFGVFPYLAGTVFLIGSLIRFEKSQYTWRTGSSQLLSGGPLFRAGSILFHVGIILLFFGHLFGLLTPTWVYTSLGLSVATKQLLAITAGSIFGLLCLAGIVILVHRRMTNARVRASGSRMDMFILWLLFAQLVLGLLTIPASTGHMDGSVMLLLAHWAQAIVTFQTGAAVYMNDVHWIYKAHIFLGLVMFFVFPFTRLVHIWSVPVGYVNRAYQMVRTRAV